VLTAAQCWCDPVNRQNRRTTFACSARSL